MEFPSSTLYFYSPNNAAEVLTVCAFYFCFYFWNVNSNAWFDKLEKQQQGVNSVAISKDALWSKSTYLQKEQAHIPECLQWKCMGPVCLKCMLENFSMDGNCSFYTVVTGRNTSVVVVGATICLLRGAGCGLRPCCVSNVSRYPKDVKSRSYFSQKDFRCE